MSYILIFSFFIGIDTFLYYECIVIITDTIGIDTFSYCIDIDTFS